MKKGNLLFVAILSAVVVLSACSGQGVGQTTVNQKADSSAGSQQAQKPSGSDSVEAFYKGKTVTILIGYGPGGGYDLYARLLSRHIGKHIPGNPVVIVQNMPGAGGLLQANNMYNVAPKDGSLFGTVHRGMPIEQLIGSQGIQFDAAKYNWLGSISDETSICLARSDSPVKSFEDLRTKTLRVGATGPASDSGAQPTFLNAVLGTKFDIVTGYATSNDLNMAIERGEVQGRCGLSWSSLKTTKPKWVSDGFINILVQLGVSKATDLPNVPLVLDFAKDEQAKNMVEVFFAPLSMGRPYATPPGVPAERVAALRKAFMETMNDPEFKAEAEKSKQEINPMSGEDLQKLVEQMMKTPKDQAQTLSKYIQSQTQD